MSVYTPIMKANPKAKPLAQTMSTPADIARAYDEWRTIMGIVPSDEYEECSDSLGKRILFYGSAALIGIALRLMLKNAGLA